MSLRNKLYKKVKRFENQYSSQTFFKIIKLYYLISQTYVVYPKCVTNGTNVSATMARVEL